MSGVRLRALLWGVMAIGLAISAFLQFSAQLPLQTNLLALLPPTERNPLAEEAVNRLADAAGNRAVFLVGRLGGARRAGGAVICRPLYPGVSTGGCRYRSLNRSR